MQPLGSGVEWRVRGWCNEHPHNQVGVAHGVAVTRNPRVCACMQHRLPHVENDWENTHGPRVLQKRYNSMSYKCANGRGGYGSEGAVSGLDSALTCSCFREWMSVPSSSSSPSTLSSPPPWPSPSQSIDAVIEPRAPEDAVAPSHPDMAIHAPHHLPRGTDQARSVAFKNSLDQGIGKMPDATGDGLSAAALLLLNTNTRVNTAHVHTLRPTTRGHTGRVTTPPYAPTQPDVSPTVLCCRLCMTQAQAVARSLQLR